MRSATISTAALLATLGFAPLAHAAPIAVSSFPAGIGSVVGLGYSPITDRLWLYGNSGATFVPFSRTGIIGATIPRQGESADDADIEIAPEAFTLGTTAVPAGSLLFLNGESGVVEIYAVNPTTGALLGSLATAFGGSHVVGGGYHTSRNTFYLVQDKVPGGTIANRIAEVDPITGAVLQSFRTTDALAAYTVNYGDLDIAPNGNLLIVSSDETSILELSPTGAFVATHTLPASVDNLCGIAVDTASCDVWVTETSGLVWLLRNVGASCPADRNCDGGVDINDLLDFLAAFEAGSTAADLDNGTSTGTPDGGVDINDLLFFLARFEGGC